MKLWSGTLTLVVGGALLSGCAGPRLVSSMSTTRENKTRIIWYQNKSIPLIKYTSEQGMIDCDRGGDGQLTGCKPVKIVFKDKEN